MKAGTGRREDQRTFQLSLNYSAIVKSLPNAPLRGWQNGIQGAQAHGACECFRTVESWKADQLGARGKSSACIGVGEQGGISYHLTEQPLLPFSYPVISTNAVLNPAVVVSSGHYHPHSINEETRAEVTHSVSSGPLAPKPLPFLDQENGPE